jgi:hypothetical protein
MSADYQLYALELAIQGAPQAPINYLLRGEYWLRVGDLYQAKADVLKAQHLAAKALPDSEWGYLYQSYLDRAAELLEWIGEV